MPSKGGKLPTPSSKLDRVTYWETPVDSTASALAFYLLFVSTHKWLSQEDSIGRAQTATFNKVEGACAIAKNELTILFFSNKNSIPYCIQSVKGRWSLYKFCSILAKLFGFK